MLISCDFYFLGLFRINSNGDRPAWDIYPQGMSDKEWRRYYRRIWLQSWCQYLFTIKLVKE